MTAVVGLVVRACHAVEKVQPLGTSVQYLRTSGVGLSRLVDYSLFRRLAGAARSWYPQPASLLARPRRCPRPGNSIFRMRRGSLPGFLMRRARHGSVL
jgi:hypothetical protein